MMSSFVSLQWKVGRLPGIFLCNMFARCHLYHLFRTFLLHLLLFFMPWILQGRRSMFWRRHPCVRCQCQTAKMEVRRRTKSAEDQWMCASKTRQMIDASFLSIIMSYVVFTMCHLYISVVCVFVAPGWLLRRHLLNIPCFCVARSPDWGRLLLWDHHLHAVQRKEAMTLAEMFEMLMKMRAKEHITKTTLMSPGHFVCLALTRPNMCKTDRRMFFFSGLF